MFNWLRRLRTFVRLARYAQHVEPPTYKNTPEYRKPIYTAIGTGKCQTDTRYPVHVFPNATGPCECGQIQNH